MDKSEGLKMNKMKILSLVFLSPAYLLIGVFMLMLSMLVYTAWVDFEYKLELTVAAGTIISTFVGLVLNEISNGSE